MSQICRDDFPDGIKVLAVDDDPIFLKILECYLIRCKYHVTTTNSAITALKILRENSFDLVISDVHMPEMDGFMLLETVGREMDIPFIMVSVDGDTKSVMKGIERGAVDYLLKPIRLEELKNIWQHLFRKKKMFVEVKDSFEPQEPRSDGQPTTQIRPRGVWTAQLHQKFVNAVNQLGLHNASPKKILDMMNVENLTRCQVKSHLQIYKVRLNRLDAAANQQANMAYPNFNNLSSTLPGYGVHDNPGITTQMDLLNFGSLGNSNIDQVSLGYNPSANTSLPGMGFDSGCSSSQDINVLMNGQINFGGSYVAEDPNNAEREIFMDGFNSESGFGSRPEDLVNSFMTNQECQDYNIVDGGEVMGFNDIYSFGDCL